jgi:hypothetical protein
MTDNFWSYIDGLGELEDDDLYMDIDDTMASRALENPTIRESKCYVEDLKKRKCKK